MHLVSSDVQHVGFCVFQTFEGNVNSGGVVRRELQHAILAHYIRFIPVDWSREGRIGLRLELYGCSYCKWTTCWEGVIAAIKTPRVYMPVSHFPCRSAGGVVEVVEFILYLFCGLGKGVHGLSG